MESTETPATRDRERTRRALLDAAGQMYLERGARTSLAAIAAHAGVSKGALTHHFRTRDDLNLALISESVTRFREIVRDHVDISENTSGKLLRGYVRALTHPDVQREVFSPQALIASVIATDSEQGRQLLEEDAQWWRAAFAADGMDPAVSTAVRAAADGLAAAVDTPFFSAAEHAAARAWLLELATLQA